MSSVWAKGCATANLMVIVCRLARINNVYPIGSSTGTVNVGGRTWELWIGYNGSMKVFSFVPYSPVNSFSTDVKQFFNHIQNTQGFPAGSQHLIGKFVSVVFFFVFTQVIRADHHCVQQSSSLVPRPLLEVLLP